MFLLLGKPILHCRNISRRTLCMLANVCVAKLAPTSIYLPRAPPLILNMLSLVEIVESYWFGGTCSHTFFWIPPFQRQQLDVREVYRVTKLRVRKKKHKPVSRTSLMETRRVLIYFEHVCQDCCWYGQEGSQEFTWMCAGFLPWGRYTVLGGLEAGSCLEVGSSLLWTASWTGPRRHSATRT